MLFSYSEIFNNFLFWSNTLPRPFFKKFSALWSPSEWLFLLFPGFLFFWVPYFLPHSACLLFPPIDAFETPDVILSAYCNFFALHLHLFFFFFNFHFIVLSEKPIFLSVFKDLDFYMGFGGGCGAAPGGLNWSAGVWSFQASQEGFLTTLLWMAQFRQ